MKFGVLGVPRGPGAGGPDPQYGRRPGTVCFGLASPAGEWEEEIFLRGDPAQVVGQATERALTLLEEALQRSTAGR
ncbi:CinA family protein [Knoellia sp. CPCC 206435]|uniref:CinA family protein n=1 Tax=Knoellia terrae TaxID=3404797 RepID=UPI003B434A0B